ncbi:unnamed protein product [Porites evermanni]|uniref:Uncharacterized protein n=1 Tax=Porites evermanni TaxID=104178 RepID=A0ABN8STP0_9CNID|nr:unnamed protein product [Porites evermanni]
MDGSTLAFVGDVDYIAFGEGPTDFSMQVLNHRDSQVEVRPKSVNAVSNGLQRSFSYAMEGTMVSREVDLYEVCREGDVVALNTLLETSQPNLDHSNAKGLSALHYAARNNHAEVIQLLINHGADPNVRSRVEHKALSPLHFAAWFNAAKAVDVLLRNGANVESGSAFGQKPLHYAVSRASPELVMTLITKGKANLNGLDNHRFSPLHLATQRGRLDIIKILIEHGADISAVNEESETAIHIAAREGRDEVLRHLLQRVSMTGLSCKDLVNKENDEAKTCLHLAVQGGHVEAAMVCLEYGANLQSVKKSRDHLPLHVASSLGDLQMVKFLLSHDLIKVDEEDSGGMTPILRASLSGNVEVIEHLINKVNFSTN